MKKRVIILLLLLLSVAGCSVENVKDNEDILALNPDLVQYKIPAVQGEFVEVRLNDMVAKIPDVMVNNAEIRILNCDNQKDIYDSITCMSHLNSGGTYVDNVIIVKESINPLYFHRALMHETGHHIWETKLSSSFKETWVMTYDGVNGASNYANVKLEDNFAEAFAIYYVYGKAMPHQINLLLMIDEELEASKDI